MGLRIPPRGAGLDVLDWRPSRVSQPCFMAARTVTPTIGVHDTSAWEGVCIMLRSMRKAILALRKSLASRRLQISCEAEIRLLQTHPMSLNLMMQESPTLIGFGSYRAGVTYAQIA